jgi:hypothetical protein
MTSMVLLDEFQLEGTVQLVPQRECKKKRKSADDRAWPHETQNLFFGIYKRRGLLTRSFILTLAVPIKLLAWG